jgi:UDP:flavonoid glycosyltransferase YjiC (YdhE family)
MARILFAWELGGGLGHVTCQRPLAVGLRQRGHEVVVAVRDIRPAANVFADSGIAFVQCPIRTWRIPTAHRPPLTYGHLLYNVGFHNVPGLAALTAAWRTLFELVDPDLIVFDHSPVALLAARSHRAKRVLLGTGFCAPPATNPLPKLRPRPHTESAKLIKDENQILSVANEVLKRHKLPKLPHLGALYGDIDQNLLTTFAELDHFGPRENVRYWGAQLSCPASPPVWPRASGKRIFAYLKRTQGLADVLKTLRDMGLPTIVFGNWVDQRVRRRFGSKTLTLANRPLDIATVSTESDLAILNATHGTTAEFLLSGTPILQLPILLEQYLTAKNTVRIGAGLTANRKKPDVVAAQLERLVSSETYQQGARRFAEKYADFDADKTLDEMVELVIGLLT